MYIQVYVKRREARLTKAQVAERLNLSREWYSKKEKGAQDFTLREGKALAELFNCTLDELFTEKIGEGA